MQIVEDGESFGGPIPAGYVMRLTLGEDGKYEYYYYSPGEDGDEPETITESGYWTFDKESSKIVGVIDDENGYGVSALGETDVLVWTASKLVTRFSDDDGYTQTTTWTR